MTHCPTCRVAYVLTLLDSEETIEQQVCLERSYRFALTLLMIGVGGILWLIDWSILHYEIYDLIDLPQAPYYAVYLGLSFLSLAFIMGLVTIVYGCIDCCRYPDARPDCSRNSNSPRYHMLYFDNSISSTPINSSSSSRSSRNSNRDDDAGKIILVVIVAIVILIGIVAIYFAIIGISGDLVNNSGQRRERRTRASYQRVKNLRPLHSIA